MRKLAKTKTPLGVLVDVLLQQAVEQFLHQPGEYLQFFDNKNLHADFGFIYDLRIYFRIKRKFLYPSKIGARR